MQQDTQHLDHSVRLAAANVAEGGGPFGAVVVKDGKVVAEGQNRVTRDLDPSAHAEVVAIRAACRALGTFSLEGCVLYSSCEPCPMCLTTSLWARVDRVVFAADRHDAADAGFDDQAFYDFIEKGDRSAVPTAVEHLPTAARSVPFEAWKSSPGKVEY